MRAVIFGAGNIGRGLLAPVLHAADYELTFVDANTALIEQLKKEKTYRLMQASERGLSEIKMPVESAIKLADKKLVRKAVAAADVVVTAVGKQNLAAVASTLAYGLSQRTKNKDEPFVPILAVACENMLGNTSYLREQTLAHVPQNLREKFLKTVAFPDCVVDRIARASPEHGPLSVVVEEYYQLTLDHAGLGERYRHIPGIDVSRDLRATLEQKLCTLNMAHAIIGYFGYLSGERYVHEAAENPHIKELLQGALEEVRFALTEQYATITRESQDEYAHKVMQRFRNPYLQDEVTRVARDPMRKLGAHDRLVRPLLLNAQFGKIPAFLASGVSAALHYDYSGDAQAMELVSQIRTRGIERVVEEVCDISSSDIMRLIKADYFFRAL